VSKSVETPSFFLKGRGVGECVKVVFARPSQSIADWLIGKAMTPECFSQWYGDTTVSPGNARREANGEDIESLNKFNKSKRNYK